jgi:hypothetical protein
MRVCIPDVITYELYDGLHTQTAGLPYTAVYVGAVVLVGYLTGDRRHQFSLLYRGVDKSLARPTSRCILFDG